MGESDKTISLPNLRVLWVFVRPHRRTLLLGMLLGLVGTGAALATPMVTKSVLDGLGSGQSFSGAVWLLVVLLVIGSAVLYVQWILLGMLAERIVLGARKSMVRRYFRAKVGALSTRPTGELVTRVTSDTVLLREAASSALVQIVNSTIALIGVLLFVRRRSRGPSRVAEFSWPSSGFSVSAGIASASALSLYRV